MNILKFLNEPVKLPRWEYLFMLFVCWGVTFGLLLGSYDNWSAKHELASCIAQHLSQCDIGDTQFLISYNESDK